MIGLLIYILIVILIFGAIFYALQRITLAEPFRSAAYVVLLILFVIILLGIIGIIPGWTPIGRPLV
jgi:hypothetical protein